MGNIKKKAEKRLATRISYWESLKDKKAFTKPGSKKYKK